MSVAGPENVVDEVHRLGIGTEVKPVLSSAIGASDVTMLDHVEAYGVFATQGTRHDPVAIVKVLDSDGNDITAHPNGGEKIADAASLYIVNNILKGYPSWWGPQLGHPNLGFDRPMGVKSGTSNVGTSTGDGWLMAYNPDLVIATWAGHTSNDPRAGNQTRQFFGVYEGYWMTVPILRALTGSEWRDDFRQPSGVTQVNCQLPPDVKTIQTPSGGELVLAGDNPPCAAPSPSPSVSASPTELPSPSPTIPSPLSEISPTPRRGASPTPSASPSP